MATGKRSSYTSEQKEAVLATVRAKGVCAAAKVRSPKDPSVTPCRSCLILAQLTGKSACP
jgi:hypothetical protein